MIEIVKETNYGGAYDVDPGQYFTREDIVDFAEQVCSHLDEIYSDSFEISDLLIYNNSIDLTVINEDGYEFDTTIRIDMRRIHKPSDIDKYISSTVDNLRKSIDSL